MPDRGLPPAGVVDALRAAGCVFAEDEARLLLDAADGGADLGAMLAQRVAGLPLEQILGWAEFCGLRVAVEPGVFVPRRRTEFLVGEALAHIARLRRRAVVVDLCCGSGAIGAAVAARGGAGVELYATDIDPVAVRCARRNLADCGGQVLCGDLFEPLPRRLRGGVDLLVANVPYVPSSAVALMPPEAREHEPRVALDGGADGLDVFRRVAAGAAEWLAAGGALMVESSARQAPAAARVLADAGLVPHVVSSAEYGATVVTGGAPAAEPAAR